MQATEYDAIVVGSGISGGWAAKELTEKGPARAAARARTQRRAHQGLRQRDQGPWEYPHRGGRTQAMEELYPVLKRDYPLNEKNLDFWASDKESPYTEVKRFDWYRGYQVGGRSLMWGRQSYRLSDFDFEANAQGRHRHRLADPLRRHRAVVRPRRAARRHLRHPREAAATARRTVPAADAAQLRRGDGRGPAREAVRRQAPPHSRARREPDARRSRAAARASTATRAGSAARTARTSARSRRRCRRR